MYGNRIRETLIVIVVQIPWLSVASADENQFVRIVPEETDEILANPGMGWETFHRTAKQDKNLPSWIPSTVQYARWGWRELEPRPGKIDYAFLDTVLKETRESGQKLAFRVMCCSPYPGRPYHPHWLKELGGRILVADHNGVTDLPIPDMDDPIIVKAHLDFIKRLGERYDGHPDIDHLDLGSIGWWGEWHLSGSKNCKLPTVENRMKVVDAYLAAFKNTPLVMLINGKECTTYAIQHDTGWRADSLGPSLSTSGSPAPSSYSRRSFSSSPPTCRPVRSMTLRTPSACPLICHRELMPCRLRSLVSTPRSRLCSLESRGDPRTGGIH